VKNYPADEEFDLAYSVNQSFARAMAATSIGAWVYADGPNTSDSYTPTKKNQYGGFGTGELTAHKSATGILPGPDTRLRQLLSARRQSGEPHIFRR
jgi:hypothetical protein